MKIEKINDNKIKVTISLDDLEERNIDINALNYNSPAAQELIWDMVQQAEMEFGLNISDSQLIIEPVPDSEDGFIVTITKMDEDGDFESIHKYIKSRFKRNELRTKKRNRSVCSPMTVYVFDSFEDLCGACKRIETHHTGESSLYQCKGTYYLVLSRSSTSDSSHALDMLVGEFGHKLSNPSYFEGYLNEYGTRIMESSAIETINLYF